MKFEFSMSVVVEARSVEDALQAIANHISTVSRQAASGIDDVGAEFSIKQADDKAEAVDLTDRYSAKNGPIPLDLDPESVAGIAHAEQLARQQTEREAAAAAQANVGRSDAEIMAEHSANEQAALKA